MVKKSNSRLSPEVSKSRKKQTVPQEDHSKHSHAGPLTIIILFVIFLVIFMGLGYYYYNYYQPIPRAVPSESGNSTTTGTSVTPAADTSRN